MPHAFQHPLDKTTTPALPDEIPLRQHIGIPHVHQPLASTLVKHPIRSVKDKREPVPGPVRVSTELSRASVKGRRGNGRVVVDDPQSLVPVVGPAKGVSKVADALDDVFVRTAGVRVLPGQIKARKVQGDVLQAAVGPRLVGEG